MKLVRGEQGTWKFGKHFRTIRHATSEDSDHLLMQGQSDFAVCGNTGTWRDYKSLVKYITVSVKVLHAFCGV